MKRLKRHPESKSFAWKLSVALALTLILTVSVAAAITFATDVFRVRKIKVSGRRLADPLCVRYLEEVAKGQIIFFLDTGSIRKNLKRDIWISEVKIRRTLPGNLEVSIIEREPCAVYSRGGAEYIIDETGYCVTVDTRGEFAGLPKVRGIVLEGLKPSSRIANFRVRKCMRAIFLMSQDLRRRIVQVYPCHRKGIVFTLRTELDLVNLIYGEFERLREKDEIALAVLQDIERRNRRVKYIDVSVPESPVTG